jgi:bifunctional DNA-binding transcriptional regulator/antitoxin component of YhaV-PrlF toxin-antitoxin module|tara:strand:- start:287 stop:475 length:189 start_codon:yes stop_codon:yes gene_type:complete
MTDTNKTDKARYEVITQENSEGDLILPLPRPLLKSLGWKEGTPLDIGIDDEGNLYLKKGKSI